VLVVLVWLVLLLEEEQVVGGGHGDHVLLWVPGSVEDLFVEVQAVDADLVFLAFTPGTHLSRFEHSLWLGHFPGRLEGHLLAGIAVEHPEKVVVAAGHDRSVIPVPTTFKLVEDAVVLVERTQLGS